MESQLRQYEDTRAAQQLVTPDCAGSRSLPGPEAPPSGPAAPSPPTHTVTDVIYALLADRSDAALVLANIASRLGVGHSALSPLPGLDTTPPSFAVAQRLAAASATAVANALLTWRAFTARQHHLQQRLPSRQLPLLDRPSAPPAPQRGCRSRYFTALSYCSALNI